MKSLLFFWLALLMASCKPQYLRFDPHPPGFIPKVFAKELISPKGEHVGYCAFSPDGSELYYALTTDDWFPSTLIRISAKNLAKKDSLHLIDQHYEGEPFITRDGNTLYFMAVLPPAEGEQWHSDLFRAHKTSRGWGAPERLDSLINSTASEWHLSVTDRGVLYFSSEREAGTNALHGDIYRLEPDGAGFKNLSKLPAPISTEFNDSDPLIAPDESFLIFHSDRPGGYGQHDLYISFREQKNWTAPRNMGESINTAEWEMAPSLTPDGKYLLFTRRKEMETTEPAQIYWVSTKILKQYR